MTSVAAWYEPHDKASWIVADTRISGAIGVLSDAGAKVFPLSIVCMQPNQSGEFVHKAAYSLGFAYSGSTLPALMTYALANTCLSRLIGLADAEPCSVEEVADFLRRMAELYCREIQQTFEAIVVGWCPIKKLHRAFVLSPLAATTEKPELQMVSAEAPLYEKNHFVLIGSHQDAVRNRIVQAYTELDGQSLKRAPKLALQRLIEEDELKGIGGSLQIGTAVELHFSLKWWVHPLKGGKPPQAGRYLLGLDMDSEIGSVGGYAVGGIGTV